MDFLWNKIDLIVLSLCFVFTLLNTFRMVRAATEPIREVPAFFLIFGATSIVFFMGFGHLFEISYHAVENIMKGTFVFDFRFYSLILMGMLLLSLSVGMLQRIADRLNGKTTSSYPIFKSAILIVLISAPAGIFTPIAYVPAIACLISLLFLPLTVKKRVPEVKKKTVIEV
jgi:hypothetical protein